MERPLTAAPATTTTTTTTTPKTTYEPLPATDSFIRYLRLEPGHHADPLRCSLRLCPLGHAPPFEAVSYVWGDPAKVVPVLLDGRESLVTANLGDVLRQVRTPSRTRALWVDALCINQDDGAEKSAQVAIMGRIYHAASRVLICLAGIAPGLVDTRGPAAASPAAAAASAAALLRELNDTILERLQQTAVVREWNALPYLAANDPLATDERWRAVQCLLDHPWFRRGWTIQECVLANEATICWAATEIPWLHVARTLAWARRDVELVSRYSIHNVATIYLVPYLLAYRHEAMALFKETDYRTLCTMLTPLHLLQRVKYANVTDPRDRVYALLGLMDALCVDPPPVTVDYQKSHLAVYSDVAAASLAADGSAFLLHYVEHDESSIADTSCPSWVPRWDVCNELGLVDSYKRMPDIVPYLHALSTSVRAEEKLLKITGVVVDKLVFASDNVLSSSTTIHDVLDIWLAVSAYPSCGAPYNSNNNKNNNKNKNMAMSPLLAFLIATWNRRGLEDTTANMAHTYAAYAQWLHGNEAAPPKAYHAPSPDALRTHAQVSAWGMVQGKRLFLTERGYIGLGPRVARTGDLCAVLFGGTKTPFLLRQDAVAHSSTAKAGPDSRPYRVLGHCSWVSHVVAPTGCYQWFGQANEWDEFGLEEEDIVLC